MPISGRKRIDVYLERDIYELDSTVVSATSDRINISNGRIIVHLNKFNTKGKLLSEVMNKMPLVKVTDDEIKMFGKENVTIFINSHQVRLRGTSLINYLNSFPPEVVTKVEILSSALTEFDSDEDKGIIKIDISRNDTNGLCGQLITGYYRNHYDSGMLSTYANYADEQFYFDLNAYGTINENYNNSSYSSLFPNTIVCTDNPKKWSSEDIMLVFESGYNFRSSGNLSVNIQVPLYADETVADLDNVTKYIDCQSNELDSLLTSVGTTTKGTRQYDFDLFYNRAFGKTHLYVSSGYARNVVNNSRNWVSVTTLPESAPLETSLYSTGSLKYNIWTTKIDLTFPLLGFEAKVGYKYSNVNTFSDNIVSKQLSGDQSNSNTYRYFEYINAGYFSINRRIGNFSLATGLRCEYASTNGESYPTEEPYNAVCLDFFPSFTASYKIGDNIISASYERRINRPQFQDLDPFRWYTSKYDYTEGNPLLKPSYINDFKINYLFSDILLCQTFFKTEKNAIGKFVVLDPMDINKQVQVVNNFLNKKSLGLSTEYSTQIKNWLDINVSAELTYNDYESNSQYFLNSGGFASALSASFDFHLGDKWNVYINSDEYPPGTYNYRVCSNSFRTDIGGIYTDSKKRFSFKLAFKDIFKSSSPSYYYLCNGIKQKYDNYYDTRSVTLTFSLKFGKRDAYNHKTATSSGENERERL